MEVKEVLRLQGIWIDVLKTVKIFWVRNTDCFAPPEKREACLRDVSVELLLRAEILKGMDDGFDGLGSKLNQWLVSYRRYHVDLGVPDDNWCQIIDSIEKNQDESSRLLNECHRDCCRILVNQRSFNHFQPVFKLFCLLAATEDE